MSDNPIQSLLSRQSVKFVRAPGPTEEHLSLILQAAMRAPDHGKLRPWRFALVRENAVGRFADLAIALINASDWPMPPEKEASTRRWLSQVPLLIAIACRMDTTNQRIPEHERMLATGAAVTNMLSAAHMLGYGAYWSTGLGTYNDEVAAALGFDALDYRFMGYLAVGTPIDPPPRTERPDWSEFVTDWSGPVA
ncbi:MAG TPA: nitroreductase [Burkholderiaceae bacterium]|nr:nitroreductase [Burkholderiaceae bacterium]